MCSCPPKRRYHTTSAMCRERTRLRRGEDSVACGSVSPLMQSWVGASVHGKDPFHKNNCIVLISCLVGLSKSSELYRMAHALVGMLSLTSSTAVRLSSHCLVLRGGRRGCSVLVCCGKLLLEHREVWTSSSILHVSGVCTPWTVSHAACSPLVIHMLRAHRWSFTCRRKATTLNPRFTHSWLGLGHACAAQVCDPLLLFLCRFIRAHCSAVLQDESDQAMASYRTSYRLFPGCHLPLLCMGIECARQKNHSLCEQYLQQAREMCPWDPTTTNELGVAKYREGEYVELCE